MGLWRRFARRNAAISTLSTLVVRLATLALLAGALELGLTNRVFALSSVTVATLTVDPDTTLLLLGVINKIADYLLEYVLDDIAGKCLVYWMVNADPDVNPSAGAYVNDFEMIEELTKPWIAIGAFWSRSRHQRWLRGRSRTFWDWIRAFLSLAVSICFLLLGAGINTIGMPQGRWYPDSFALDKSQLPPLLTQRMVITGTDFGNYWGKAGRQVGTVPETANTSVSLIAQDVFKGLDGLFDTFAPNQAPRGFAPVSEYPSSNPYAGSFDASSVTAINSTVSSIEGGAAVNSTSTWGPSLSSVYQDLLQQGPEYARAGSGLLGVTNHTRAMLTTVCSEGLFMSPNSTVIVVQTPASTPGSDGLIGIQLPAIADLSSPGFTCNISFHQIIFPCDWGRLDSQGWWWAGDKGYDLKHQNMTLLPSYPTDLATFSTFGGILSSVMPWLDNVSSGHSFARHALLVARHLQDQNAHQNLTSDLLATTAVVATTVQNLMTIADWQMEPDNSTTEMVQHSARFYIYGSGPRMAWEWIAAVVLGILAIVVLVNIIWIVIDPSPPSHLLEPAGMMLVANSSPTMESAEKSEKGELNPANETARFYVIDDQKDTEELTDNKARMKGVRRKPGWWSFSTGRKAGHGARRRK